MNLQSRPRRERKRDFYFFQTDFKNMVRMKSLFVRDLDGEWEELKELQRDMQSTFETGHTAMKVHSILSFLFTYKGEWKEESMSGIGTFSTLQEPHTGYLIEPLKTHISKGEWLKTNTAEKGIIYLRMDLLRRSG